MTEQSSLGKIFWPILLAAMCACVAQSLIGAARLLVPTWNGSYLLVAVIVASLEACYSYWIAQRLALRGSDLLKFRVTEWLLLFLLVRLGVYAGQSPAAIWGEIQRWPGSPELVISDEVLVACMLVLLFWRVTTHSIHDLERLKRQIDSADDSAPLQNLGSRFFQGGALLLLCAGITQIGWASLLDLQRPSISGVVINVLLYYMLGLTTLSQVRLATLQQRWRNDAIAVPASLNARWRGTSLVFVGLAALLAFMLPTGYTIGLLDIGRLLIDIVGLIAWGISSLVILLLIQPIAWLLASLGMGNGVPQLPERPKIQRPLSEAGDPASWVELTQTLIFWVIALVVIVVVVRLYLRDHPGLLQLLGRQRLGQVGGWWRRLWGWLRLRLGARRTALPARRSRRTSGQEQRPWRFFRLGARSPREQIIYYYLSMLRRAGEAGVPRRQPQTPHEYRGSLEPSLPEARDELARLTDAFVEARYAPHEVEPQQASRARGSWQRIKHTLKSLRKPHGDHEAQ